MINKLIELLTGKCQYNKKCVDYRTNSVTCNSEAGEYCETYRRFKTSKK